LAPTHSQIIFLTGGPGSGKTYTILKAIQAIESDLCIVERLAQQNKVAISIGGQTLNNRYRWLPNTHEWTFLETIEKRYRQKDIFSVLRKGEFLRKHIEKIIVYWDRCCNDTADKLYGFESRNKYNKYNKYRDPNSKFSEYKPNALFRIVYVDEISMIPMPVTAYVVARGTRIEEISMERELPTLFLFSGDIQQCSPVGFPYSIANLVSQISKQSTLETFEFMAVPVRVMRLTRSKRFSSEYADFIDTLSAMFSDDSKIKCTGDTKVLIIDLIYQYFPHAINKCKYLRRKQSFD